MSTLIGTTIDTFGWQGFLVAAGVTGYLVWVRPKAAERDLCLLAATVLSDTSLPAGNVLVRRFRLALDGLIQDPRRWHDALPETVGAEGDERDLSAQECARLKR